jgi:phosphopantothenoylcysteine decarboxylase/phosphopantothenate--cysteine ligase
MNMLKNKNILVGVTGSIAVYKTLELIRLFKKAGATVQVVMSQSALEFVSELTFETISGNRVLTDSNQEWGKKHFNHISVTKGIDLFVIAPITANSINKIANGISDNILTQTVLAYKGKKLLAPAANTNMIQNPITVTNLQKLQKFGFEIVSTQVKELACRDIGDGAMSEPINIFHESIRVICKDEYWSNQRVMVTGGGTVEKIDDFRCVTNFSSGKMSVALSKVLYYCGAEVTLVLTKQMSDIPDGIEVVIAPSSKEMYEVLNSNTTNYTHLFMAAAVSDYIPSYQEGKIKKADKDSLKLEMTQNIDIIKSINRPNLIKVGFKAEADKTKAKQSALNMLENKNLDYVCLNVIDENNKFGSDMNEISFYNKEKKLLLSRKDSKLKLSFEILDGLKHRH